MPRAALMVLCLSLAAPAWAIYKCEADGKVTYSQLPCPDGHAVQLANDAPAPADAEQARKDAARQKKEVQRLERERHKREAKEEKEQQRIARANAAKNKKCAALALHKKWADEDAMTATRKSLSKAQRKARRAAEKYELECGR